MDWPGSPACEDVARKAAARAAGSPGIRAITARWSPSSAWTRDRARPGRLPALRAPVARARCGRRAAPASGTELPAITPHITEYRCQRRQCPGCGQTTLAALPEEVVGQFGPQLTALIAYLTVVCRLPRLVVQRFLAGALQIPISLGSTQKAWEEASAAVATPYDELAAALRDEPVLNADETGHRSNGEKRWLWAIVARAFVVYRIAASRGADVLQTVVGETFAGILGSDRLPTYLTYVVGQRQFCWAHITRNLLSALDLATTPSARRFCREALALDRRLFRLWHRYRGDPTARGTPVTRAELIAKVWPIERRFFALASRSLDAANADVRNLARAFFEHHPHFFTFVHKKDVEPTNNTAERALRTAVVQRKIMLGTRSDHGERAVERLLTIARTCQLQHLNALVYLTAAITRMVSARPLRRCYAVLRPEQLRQTYVPHYWPPPFYCQAYSVQQRTINHGNVYGLALDNPYPAYYSFYGAQFDHVLDSHNLNTTGPIPWMPSRAGDYAISWIATINATVCGMTPSQTDILLATIHVRSALHKGSPCNGTLAGGSELPASGLGYYHHLGTDPPGTDDWGGAEAMLTLIANVGADWNASIRRRMLALVTSAATVAAFSSAQLSPNGRDADIRYLRADAQDLPLDLTTDPSA